MNKKEIVNQQLIEGIDILLKHKPRNLSLLKACEELNELATEILKFINKNEDNILEEVIDVYMHITLLMKMYNQEEVLNMLEKKVYKFITSNDYKLYLEKENLELKTK